MYTDEGVASAERALERLLNALRSNVEGDGEGQLDVEPYRKRFIAAMDDDLNTPQALATLFDLAHEINRHKETGAAVKGAQRAFCIASAVSAREFAKVTGSPESRKIALPSSTLVPIMRTTMGNVDPLLR